jgi:hypothetical protein
MVSPCGSWRKAFAGNAQVTRFSEKGRGEIGQMNSGCCHASDRRFCRVQSPIAGVKRGELVMAEIAFDLLDSSKLS